MAAPSSLIELVRSTPSTSTSPIVVLLMSLQCPTVPLLPDVPQGGCEANFSSLLHQLREAAPSVQVYPIHFEEGYPYSIRVGGGVIVDRTDRIPQFPFQNPSCQHVGTSSGDLLPAVDVRPEWCASTRPLESTHLLNSTTCATLRMNPVQCPSCGYQIGNLASPPPSPYGQQLVDPRQVEPHELEGYLRNAQVESLDQQFPNDPLCKVSSLPEQELDEMLALIHSPTP